MATKAELPRRGRPPDKHPLQVFEDALADAEQLLHLARVLVNARARRMRAELRATYGSALGLAKKDHAGLDCVESDELFIVIKPGGISRRDHFTEPSMRPLLRQAIVAVAAAVESYTAEKAATYVTQALRDRPERLRGISVKLGHMLEIEDRYERAAFGYRALLKAYLESEASSHPDKMGMVFSVVGQKVNWDAIDSVRKVPKRTSRDQLIALTDRRNRIAHTGDRKGAGREPLSIEEAQGHLDNVRSVVLELEKGLP